jgi:putative ABC transport system permease protein
MSQLRANIRFALRSIARHRSFFGIAILLLAGSLGATTAMFGLVRSLLLSPLPLPRSEELSVIWTTRAEEKRFKASLPDLYDWRARTTTLSHLTAMRSWLFALSLPGKPALGVHGEHVVGDFFGTLGVVEPLHGRLLTSADDRLGGPRVAVISAALFRDAFESDRSLLGGPLLLDGLEYTLVGVAPDGFGFGFPGETRANVWVPMSVGHPAYSQRITSSRDSHECLAVARRKPSVSEQQVEADLSRIAAEISREHPGHRIGVRVTSFHSEAVRTSRELIWSLFAAISLVFLLVCSNLASLLMSRNHARRAELSLRAALGASRGRLVRQLVTETVVLFLLAVPLAVLIAQQLLGVFYRIAATDLALLGIPVRLDGLVLAACTLVSLLSGLVFGTIPALSATRIELASVLKESAAAASPARAQRRVRGGLAVAQIAIAQALLLCTGLSIHALREQMRVPLGFEPKNVVVGSVLAATERYADLEQVVAFYDQVMRRLAAHPGVESVAANNTVPPHDFEAIYFEIDGQPVPRPEQRPLFESHDRVTPGYFRTMGIPLLAGRDFTSADNARAPPVLIVSRSAETRFFGGSALGKRVRLHGARETREIVGVVGDVQRPGLGRSTSIEGYLPFAQDPFESMRVVVRTTDPRAIKRDFQQVVSAVDPQVPVVETWLLEHNVTWYVIGRSLATFLLVVFSATALLLATLGTYGLASHLTQQRTREIGIRMALGSPASTVCWLVVKSGLATVGLGVAIGWLLALVMARVLAQFVPGGAEFQGALFALAPLALVLSAGLACLIPAWHAVRVSPAVALRYE